MLTLDSAYKFIAKDYKETLIFCLLAAVAAFIPVFGALLLMGLSLRIISNTINNKDEIPKVFGDLGKDLIDGLKYLLFTIIIMIPFLILYSVYFMSLFNLNDVLLNDFSDISNLYLGFASSLIIMLIIFIIYSMMIPALIANYAKEKKFGAFFNINKAFSLIFRRFGLYLKLLGITFLYVIVIFVISGILSFTIIIPFLISPLLILINGKNIGEWFKEASK